MHSMEMENPYRAPEAPLVEARAGAEQARPFFVISLTKMVVLYAQRIDVDEELARLQSHITEMDRILSAV